MDCRTTGRFKKRHFRDFTPILDFVHAVEHLYEAARCVHDDAERRWTDYLRWARDCWGGNVLQVIAELREHQRQVGLPPKDCEKTDPRKVLADAVGYFQNNVSRMDYPAYRRKRTLNTVAKRHHVRIWPASFPGTQLWLGAATHDTAIVLDSKRMSLTHRIDPLVDRERSTVVNDLSSAGCVAGVGLVKRPHAIRLPTVACQA